jgi:hypothetical protein
MLHFSVHIPVSELYTHEIISFYLFFLSPYSVCATSVTPTKGRYKPTLSICRVKRITILNDIMASFSNDYCCRNYYIHSDLAKREGYWPNLSNKQVQAVNDLKAKVESMELDLGDDACETHLRLLRFMRARNFDVQKAYKMLEEDLDWRKKNSDWLCLQNAEEVLEADPNRIYKLFPTWFQGFDKEQRPVSWKCFGRFDLTIFDICDVDHLLHFHVWETEQLLAKAAQRSIEMNANIETFVVVIDAEGWKLSLTTSKTLSFIKGMASVDSSYYPERLGALCVINAPMVLSILWRTISPWLDEVTKKKIKICSSKDQWVPELQALMDEDQIPEKYGGTGPNFTPEQGVQSIHITKNKDFNLQDN